MVNLRFLVGCNTPSIGKTSSFIQVTILTRSMDKLTYVLMHIRNKPLLYSLMKLSGSYLCYYFSNFSLPINLAYSVWKLL